MKDVNYSLKKAIKLLEKSEELLLDANKHHMRQASNGFTGAW